jgi:WD40 repeat protein
VWSVAVSPDSQTIASGGADGTLRLWDMTTGQAKGAPLGGFAFWIYSVAFRPDGKQLASAGLDGKVRLWDLTPDTWIQKACDIAGRDLSPEEWSRFVGSNRTFQPTCP